MNEERAYRTTLGRGPSGEAGRRAIRLKRAVLVGLIDDMLLEGAAREHEVLVDSERIDDALVAFAEEFPDRAAFEAHVARRPGGLPALRLELRRQVLRAALLPKPVPITEAEITAFYEQNTHRFDRPAHLLVDEIVFLDRPERDETTELVALRERILSEDLSFRHMARRVSESESKTSGGDLGRVTASSVDAAVWVAARDLPVAAISQPVSLSDRTVLLQVRDRVPASSTSLDAAREEIREALATRRRGALEAELLLGLRAEAEITNLFDERYERESEVAAAGGGDLLLDRDVRQGTSAGGMPGRHP